MLMPDIQGLINYNKETPYYTTQRITSFSPQVWAILEDVNACFLKVTPWNTDSTRLSFINLEDSMVTLSSILAWRIPWTEEPGRLQSTGSQGQTGLKWQSAHCQLSGSSSTPSLVAQAVKSPPAVQETWVRSLPGGEKGYPLLSSCLEDSMDRGAWQAIYSPWDRKESYTTER